MIIYTRFLIMKQKAENILVTGGAGFIGSHLTEKLLQSYRVTVLDNLSTGNQDNLINCQDKKAFQLIVENLNEIKKLPHILQNIDTIFHLAAYPEVSTGFANPEKAYRENVDNTFQLLENIRKSNIRNFIFASSSVVYGEPNLIPTPETYGPLLPISVYGGSKLACEGLISSYCHNYGINCVMIRLANVIGSRSRHGVIWDFINKLNANQDKLEILGNGKQTKSYIHISDCIEGFVFCLSNINNGIEVYNLGNKDRVDVITIAKTVSNNMNLHNAKIIPSGGTKDGRGWIGDVKQMLLDISKLEKCGWHPRYSSVEAVDIASKELLKEIRTIK